LVLASPNFSYADHSAEILRHLERYANLPMSFADACLVRMSEIERDCIIFTTDRDFLTYRRNRRQAIPLISPFGAWLSMRNRSKRTKAKKFDGVEMSRRIWQVAAATLQFRRQRQRRR
jgi:rRNA-processing protein FCF1